MPANVRQNMKQELQRAADNLDHSMEHLRRVAETYKEHHGEITETLEVATLGLLQIQEVIQKLRTTI